MDADDVERITSNLTSADCRLLIDLEDEYDRRGQFTRIFPSPFSQSYLRYFAPRCKYPDLLLSAWTNRYFHVRQEGRSFFAVSLRRLCNSGTNVQA